MLRALGFVFAFGKISLYFCVLPLFIAIFIAKNIRKIKFIDKFRLSVYNIRINNLSGAMRIISVCGENRRIL